MLQALWKVPFPFGMRVQLLRLKLPPAPPSLHDTLPVGVVGPAAVSRTVAVRVFDCPGDILPTTGVMLSMTDPIAYNPSHPPM